ncbi:MAG: hypothetical protein ACPG80_04120 [Rickettsiales bacterium]
MAFIVMVCVAAPASARMVKVCDVEWDDVTTPAFDALAEEPLLSFIQKEYRESPPMMKKEAFVEEFQADKLSFSTKLKRFAYRVVHWLKQQYYKVFPMTYGDSAFKGSPVDLNDDGRMDYVAINYFMPYCDPGEICRVAAFIQQEDGSYKHSYIARLKVGNLHILPTMTGGMRDILVRGNGGEARYGFYGKWDGRRYQAVPGHCRLREPSDDLEDEEDEDD